MPVPEEGLSLAELWALSNELAVVRNAEPSAMAAGQYL